MEKQLILETRLDSSGVPALIIKASPNATGGDVDIFWYLLQKFSAGASFKPAVEVHPIEELLIDRFSLPTALQGSPDEELDMKTIPKMYKQTVFNLIIYPDPISDPVKDPS